MKRLTEEIELPFDSTYAPKCGAIEMGEEVGMTKMLAYDGICNKLGRYEDLDEKLGIDYTTLIKALDEGFYDRNGKYVDPVLYCGSSGWYLCDICNLLGDRYYLKDYRITWFLTKEELK